MGRVWNVLAPRNIELGPHAEGERPDAGMPGASRQWRHWKLVRDDDRIAWLLFDRAPIDFSARSTFSFPTCWRSSKFLTIVIPFPAAKRRQSA